jgi:hypothetical protein
MSLDLVQLNIERFRRLLTETTDAAKRKVLQTLLAEEEAKLEREPPRERESFATRRKGGYERSRRS